MPRQEFPKAVKVARLRHATKDGITYCEGCGVLVKPGEFAFDHDNPDGLTGKPTFENCRVLCEAVCHKIKTKKDKGNIAKAVRREAKDLGVKQPKQKIAAPPPKAPKERRFTRESLPPRPLYR